MGRSSREASLLTRRALLATARELFIERGYDHVALEDVAALAGTTRGAIYHHFANKRTLFDAVVTALHAEVADEVAAAADKAGPGWPGIHAGCTAFLRAASAARVRRVLLLDAPAVLGWRHWRSLDAHSSRRLLEEGLNELHRSGQLRAGNAQAAAILISGALNEAALWLAESPDDAAQQDAQAVLTTILVALEG